MYCIKSLSLKAIKTLLNATFEETGPSFSIVKTRIAVFKRGHVLYKMLKIDDNKRNYLLRIIDD